VQLVYSAPRLRTKIYRDRKKERKKERNYIYIVGTPIAHYVRKDEEECGARFARAEIKNGVLHTPNRLRRVHVGAPSYEVARATVWGLWRSAERARDPVVWGAIARRVATHTRALYYAFVLLDTKNPYAV